jgi:hypothetical protein
VTHIHVAPFGHFGHLPTILYNRYRSHSSAAELRFLPPKGREQPVLDRSSRAACGIDSNMSTSDRIDTPAWGIAPRGSAVAREGGVLRAQRHR